jgi:hypothetical protein
MNGKWRTTMQMISAFLRTERIKIRTFEWLRTFVRDSVIPNQFLSKGVQSRLLLVTNTVVRISFEMDASSSPLVLYCSPQIEQPCAAETAMLGVGCRWP